jgi:broad specificity phosphatase PhoE
LGYQQARELGAELAGMFARDGIRSADQITWMTSPYLRNIQTSTAAIKALSTIEGADRLHVYLEQALLNRNKLSDKANITELYEYHWIHSPEPINRTVRDRLGPALIPENQNEFRRRCEDALSNFHQHFQFNPGTAIVFMTHGSNLREYKGILTGIEMTEEEYKTAKPCSITKLSRESNTDRWQLETLLFSGHISVIGATK